VVDNMPAVDFADLLARHRPSGAYALCHSHTGGDRSTCSCVRGDDACVCVRACVRECVCHTLTSLCV
jgi:hypothetical protein